MAVIKIVRKEFDPHPMGQSEGVVYEIDDLGMVESTFNGKTESKHKIAVKIQSSEDFMEDGQPFMVYARVTVSGSKKSTLRKWREAILSKKLTENEAYAFDPEELLGIRVGYVITHNEWEGRTYANVESIWRLKDQSGTKTNGNSKPKTEKPASGNGDLPF